MNNNLTNSDNLPSEINALPINKFEQRGKNNVNIVNKGTVNFNLRDSSVKNHETEEMMAVQAFSQVYYQLLVTDTLENNSAILPANRSLLYNMTPIEIYSTCSELSAKGKEKLKTFPAIICKKNTEYYGKTNFAQMALFCYLSDISVMENLIRVSFQPLAAFRQNEISKQNIASYFGINVDCMLTDLNLTGWYVHKINIFKAFAKAGISGIPHPN